MPKLYIGDSNNNPIRLKKMYIGDGNNNPIKLKKIWIGDPSNNPVLISLKVQQKDICMILMLLLDSIIKQELALL